MVGTREAPLTSRRSVIASPAAASRTRCAPTGSFSGRLLKKDNAIAFAFDSNEDLKLHSVAIVAWIEGRLRAVLVDTKGRVRGWARSSGPMHARST